MGRVLQTACVLILALLTHNFLFLLYFILFIWIFFYGLMALLNLILSNTIRIFNKKKGFLLDVRATWEKKTIKGGFPPNWTSSQEIPSFPFPRCLNLLLTKPRFWAFLFFSFVQITSLLLAFFFNNCSIELLASFKENSVYHIKIDEFIYYMINGVFMLLNSLYLWLGINNYVQIVDSLYHNIKFHLPICYENGPKGVHLTVISPPSKTYMRDRSPSIEKERPLKGTYESSSCVSPKVISTPEP